MGSFPVEAVAMLAKIAAAAESRLSKHRRKEFLEDLEEESDLAADELIALSVAAAARRSSPAMILVPTLSGATARAIARFRLPTWITAVSSLEPSCQDLSFSWGVHPIHGEAEREDWSAFAKELIEKQGIEGGLVVLVQGPSPVNPRQNHRVDLIELD